MKLEIGGVYVDGVGVIFVAERMAQETGSGKVLKLRAVNLMDGAPNIIGEVITYHEDGDCFGCEGSERFRIVREIKP